MANLWTLVNGITYKGTVIPAGTKLSDANWDVVDMRTKGAKFVEDSLLYDPTSLASTAWTIDPTNGDDRAANGGTVKTYGEIKRRWGQNPELKQNVTISLKGDLLTTDRFDFTGVSTGEASVITIDGTPGMSVASELAALTSVTNLDTTQPSDCASYVTITGHTWSETGSYAQIKAGGSHPSAITWIGKDMTGGRARTAPFIVGPTFNSNNVNPVAGDILQIMRPPKGRNLVVAGVNQFIQFQNIDFDDFDGNGHGLTGAGYSGCTFISCILRGFFFYTQGVALYHSQVLGNFFASGSVAATVCGGRFAGGANAVQGSGMTFDNNALFENNTNIRYFGNAGNLMPSIGKVGIYDVAAGTGAVVVAQGAVALFGNSLSGQSRLYGAAGYNVEVRNYGRAFYDGGQGEAAIFKVTTSSAKYKQGTAGVSTALPYAEDSGKNCIVAWS